MEEETQNLSPWHKTKAGKIFISILVTLFGLLLIFAIFVGYYIFKIKTGSGEELAKEFYQEFTKDPALTQNDRSGKIFYDVTPFIRENNPVLGNAEAPITIIMFIDFECSSCKKAYPIIKEVAEKYEPVVKIIFKHFPLDTMHPNAENTAFAAACVNEQNKFWEYHNLLFQKENLDQESLLNYAGQLGLDSQTLVSCMAKTDIMAVIEQDQYDGLELEVQGTPTYFINGNKIEGVVPLDVWNELILNQLGN